MSLNCEASSRAEAAGGDGEEREHRLLRRRLPLPVRFLHRVLAKVRHVGLPTLVATSVFPFCFPSGARRRYSLLSPTRSVAGSPKIIAENHPQMCNFRRLVLGWIKTNSIELRLTLKRVRALHYHPEKFSECCKM